MRDRARSRGRRLVLGPSARVSSPGTRYAFRLDGGAPLADPASRAQVSGPDSWSVLVDPSAYRWQHSDWRGIPAYGQVIYEIHVGTFTKRGTWAAAADRLPHLAALGVTVVEMMPIADFRGRFGWGYDGALSYAPTGSTARLTTCAPSSTRRMATGSA